MSYTARGLLAELLSRPEGWEIAIKEMAAQKRSGRNGDGRDSVMSAYAELKANGYVTEEKTATRTGVLVTIHVYDTRQGQKPSSSLGTESRPEAPPAGTAHKSSSSQGTEFRPEARPAETMHNPSSSQGTGSRPEASPAERQQTRTSSLGTELRPHIERLKETQREKDRGDKDSVSGADPGSAPLSERAPNRRRQLTERLANADREDLDAYIDELSDTRGGVVDWGLKTAATEAGVEFSGDAEDIEDLSDDLLRAALLVTLLRLEQPDGGGVPPDLVPEFAWYPTA